MGQVRNDRPARQLQVAEASQGLQKVMGGDRKAHERVVVRGRHWIAPRSGGAGTCQTELRI